MGNNMKTLKYGNIKKAGNTLSAKDFKDIDIECMECKGSIKNYAESIHNFLGVKSWKGFLILKSENLGIAPGFRAAMNRTDDPTITRYTLECVTCSCIFTVNIEEEE